MDSRIEIVNAADSRVLAVDLSNLASGEIVRLLSEMTGIAIAENIRLFLLDVSNTQTNAAIKDASRASIRQIEAEVGRIFSALVGIGGLQKIIANAIKNDQYFARDRADALRWLAGRAAGLT